MTEPLLRRYRLSLGFFIVGLILSGLTAFPLLTELRWLGSFLGIADPAAYAQFMGLKHWIAHVWLALAQNEHDFPFMAYGTDWLAFGHLAIALFFIRPWFKPRESDWVLQCGLVCCAGVIPLAFVAGHVRGIPVYWRLIDSAFGVIGAVPLLYCLRVSRQMQAVEPIP